MTIQDGVSILRGGNDAATQYLRGRTTNELTSTFRPVIQASLDKVNATRYWREIINIYNRLPTTRQKVNPDLASYVTERALSGIFVYVAEEESKIRTNPAARVTDLLRKVFG
jgi:lysophospholipase L1-like esterase